MTDARHSGQRVKMSADRLRQQSVKLGTDSVMVRCLHDGVLVGHAFATRWVVDGKSACWVTQLCVRAQYRRRGVATTVRVQSYSFGIYC